MKTFIGNKQFYQKLWQIVIPIVIQQLLIASVQLVDNIMVGRLGESAISSVAIVNQLNFVVMIITFGLMGGAGIFTAQFSGAKNVEGLKETFRYKILAALFISTLAFLVFTIFGKTMIQWFASTNQTIQGGVDYLNVVRFGIFPFVLSIAISSTFRETGITKPLLRISIVALLVNTGLNFVLIFGLIGFPALGVVGAAIATVIARIIELLLMFVLIYNTKPAFQFSLFTIFKIRPLMVKKITLKALPLTINELFWSVGQAVFLFAYSVRGEVELAAMNVTSAVSQIVFVTFSGIATAVAVMVGNTLGENKLEEAQDNAKKLIFTAWIASVIVGIVLFIISPLIVGLYDIQAETALIAKTNLRINSFMIWFYSLNVAIYFTLRSGGDMRSTIMVDAGYMWVVMVPTILSIAYFTSIPITWMFLIVQSTEIPKFLFALWRYNKKHWVQNLALSN
jgi:putative MATE family efflux protein